MRSRLVDIFSDHHLGQLQREPTRSHTILDLFCPNKPNLVIEMCLLPVISVCLTMLSPAPHPRDRQVEPIGRDCSGHRMMFDIKPNFIKKKHENITYSRGPYGATSRRRILLKRKGKKKQRFYNKVKQSYNTISTGKHSITFNSQHQ